MTYTINFNINIPDNIDRNSSASEEEIMPSPVESSFAATDSSGEEVPSPVGSFFDAIADSGGENAPSPMDIEDQVSGTNAYAPEPVVDLQYYDSSPEGVPGPFSASEGVDDSFPPMPNETLAPGAEELDMAEMSELPIPEEIDIEMAETNQKNKPASRRTKAKPTPRKRTKK
jgi:hypothetical protein